MFGPRIALIGACLFASACGAEQPAPVDAALEPRPEPDAGAFDRDRDGDGLCDATEREAGTDAENTDTDGDGLWDLAELGNQFDPRSAGSPATDQLAVLEAVPGASLRFPVRVTVLGDGQGLTGFFDAVPSAYETGSASDYFAGAEAVSADPGDNVRGLDADAERFGAVVGETRLGFDLHFTYGAAEEPGCSRAYPFRYSLKDDLGEPVSQRAYLLLIVPSTRSGEPDPGFCLPSYCF